MIAGLAYMSGTTFRAYNFGYQGSEMDNEVAGVPGAHFTTFYRQGDTRLLRWWSVDPKASLQPWQSPYSYMDGNPVLKNDPKGDCPSCVGAAVGLVLDLGLQTIEIALDDSKTFRNDFSFASLGISTAAGATGAGLVAKAGKLAKVTRLAVEVAVDASFSAAHQVATLEEGETFDPIGVGVDVVIGQGVGNQLGNYVEEVAKNSDVGKRLADRLDHAQRVAGDSPRPSRVAKVEKAQGKLDNYVFSRAAAASISSSGAASTSVKAIGEYLGETGGSNLESQPMVDPF